MLSSAEISKVAPDVSPEKLRNARYNMLDASHDNGFMIAWQNTTYPQALGFCYIVRVDGYLVTIRACAQNFKARLCYNVAHCVGYSDDSDNLVTTFLKQAAEDMSGNYVDLINLLADRSWLWRFKGVINGKLDNGYTDNSLVWRCHWGRIIEAETRPVVDLPVKVQQKVLSRLQYFATEGQIVLER